MAAIPVIDVPGGSARPMPMIGLGTAMFPPAPAEVVHAAILDAIALGYRHFDTAAVYSTEYQLGDAIADALRRGLIASRDDVFITSKVWPTNCHADRVLPSLKQSLRKLQVEYLDLFLVHFPVSLKPTLEMEFSAVLEANKLFDFKGLMQPFDYKGVWRAMEECHKLGLTKSIGVSNFSCKKLEDILTIAKVPPAVNQVEMHPKWQQKKLMEYCKKKGIMVTAYSPLGGNGSPWGTNEVMECIVLKEIANARGKTLAQICLRWLYEQGVTIVVKSYKAERLKENIDIFDWELSNEDKHKISEIPQNKGTKGEYFVYPDGPIKSLDELWDGEI